MCHDQLLLYCRGNATSFSARVMATDNSGKCMHTNVKHFSFKILKDVVMEVPKSVESRKHPCSTIGDDVMQQ